MSLMVWYFDEICFGIKNAMFCSSRKYPFSDMYRVVPLKHGTWFSIIYKHRQSWPVLARYIMTSWHETLFIYYWPFVWGIHRLPVDSLHKGSVMRSFDVSFVAILNKLLNKHWTCRWRPSDFTEMKWCLLRVKMLSRLLSHRNAVHN